MPDPTVDIHPDVLAVDVQEIANYIAMDNEAAADRVLAEIEATYATLALDPMMGTERHPIRRSLKGIRMFVVTEYPNYLIYYRPLPDNTGVRILYVMHAARDAATFAKEQRRQ
jgi:toxin ParE1/3/4